jgi:hypothetical protein
MTKFINPLDIPQLKISLSQCGIIINNKGVDSMSYMIRSENGLKWLKSLGYMELEDYNHTPLKIAINSRLKSESFKASKQNSYQKEDFKPFAKALKYNNEKGLSSYIVLYGNTQETLKEATRQKKSKDTFMLMEIHGLHQPTKDISVNTMKMLSKIIKRKAFKIHSYDLAGDGLKHGDINAKMKDKVKTIFDTPKCINEKNTVYINETNIPNIAGVKYYDKYKKQTLAHDEEVSEDLKEWKRLEVKVIIPPEKRKCAFDYFNSEDFQEDLQKFEDIAKKFNMESEDDYLNYQLNTLCDTRGLNNKPLDTQFNSVEELEKFKNKEITRDFTYGVKK